MGGQAVFMDFVGRYEDEEDLSCALRSATRVDSDGDRTAVFLRDSEKAMRLKV